MKRPFGSISVGAEMAVAMGIDPRPFLTEKQIQEQLKISGKTREEWNLDWNKKLENKLTPF